jgi:hypothetical protein
VLYIAEKLQPFRLWAVMATAIRSSSFKEAPQEKRNPGWSRQQWVDFAMHLGLVLHESDAPAIVFPEENTSGVDKQGNRLPLGTLRVSRKGNDQVVGYLGNVLSDINLQSLIVSGVQSPLVTFALPSTLNPIIGCSSFFSLSFNAVKTAASSLSSLK